MTCRCTVNAIVHYNCTTVPPHRPTPHQSLIRTMASLEQTIQETLNPSADVRKNGMIVKQAYARIVTVMDKPVTDSQSYPVPILVVSPVSSVPSLPLVHQRRRV